MIMRNLITSCFLRISCQETRKPDDINYRNIEFLSVNSNINSKKDLNLIKDYKFYYYKRDDSKKSKLFFDWDLEISESTMEDYITVYTNDYNPNVFTNDNIKTSSPNTAKDVQDKSINLTGIETTPTEVIEESDEVMSLKENDNLEVKSPSIKKDNKSESFILQNVLDYLNNKDKERNISVQIELKELKNEIGVAVLSKPETEANFIKSKKSLYKGLNFLFSKGNFINPMSILFSELSGRTENRKNMFVLKDGKFRNGNYNFLSDIFNKLNQWKILPNILRSTPVVEYYLYFYINLLRNLKKEKMITEDEILPFSEIYNQFMEDIKTLEFKSSQSTIESVKYFKIEFPLKIEEIQKKYNKLRHELSIENYLFEKNLFANIKNEILALVMNEEGLGKKNEVSISKSLESKLYSAIEECYLEYFFKIYNKGKLKIFLNDLESFKKGAIKQFNSLSLNISNGGLNSNVKSKMFRITGEFQLIISMINLVCGIANIVKDAKSKWFENIDIFKFFNMMDFTSLDDKISDTIGLTIFYATNWNESYSKDINSYFNNVNWNFWMKYNLQSIFKFEDLGTVNSENIVSKVASLIFHIQEAISNLNIELNIDKNERLSKNEKKLSGERILEIKKLMEDHTSTLKGLLDNIFDLLKDYPLKSKHELIKKLHGDYIKIRIELNRLENESKTTL